MIPMETIDLFVVSKLSESSNKDHYNIKLLQDKLGITRENVLDLLEHQQDYLNDWYTWSDEKERERRRKQQLSKTMKELNTSIGPMQGEF